MTGRERGSALILALWTLFFLGALAMAIGGHVSASIRIAGTLKLDAQAYYLARAGVDLAVAEVMHNTSNYLADTYEEMPDVEALFRANDQLPHGEFDVSYLYYATNRMRVVTNYGVAPERLKLNLDDALSTDTNVLVELQSGLARILGRSRGRSELAEAVVAYPRQYLEREGGGNPLPSPPQRSYGGYETQLELYAVEGMSEGAFELLESQVTVFEYLKDYSDPSGAGRRRQSFGGTAEGRVLIDDARGNVRVAASQRIAFVFDRSTTNFLYWREYD